MQRWLKREHDCRGADTPAASSTPYRTSVTSLVLVRAWQAHSPRTEVVPAWCILVFPARDALCARATAQESSTRTVRQPDHQPSLKTDSKSWRGEEDSYTKNHSYPLELLLTMLAERTGKHLATLGARTVTWWTFPILLVIVDSGSKLPS